MKLLTQEIRKRLPQLYATDGKKDPIAQVKFFATWADWAWYATEFDGDDRFFGLVQGFEEELGYFLLSELEGGQATVERDLHFKRTALSEIRRRVA